MKYFRLEWCERAQGPCHQVLYSSNSSVFINDAAEAARLIHCMPTKGDIYKPFRLNPNIPDMLASDGSDWTLRREHLAPALQSSRLSASTLASLVNTFLQRLQEYVAQESGGGGSKKECDLKRLLSLFAFDCLAEGVCLQSLDCLKGSSEGVKLCSSLETLTMYTLVRQ